MLIYNVTHKVDRRSNAAFIKFMERDYLPVLMETGTIDSYFFTHLKGVDESDGITYCLLLHFSSRPAFDIYQERHALVHQKMLDGKFRGQYVSFPSTLDVVLHGQ